MKIKAITVSHFLMMILCLCSSIVEATKVVYIVSGNWGNFFDPESLKPMRQFGYNIEPMLQLYEKATSAGYDLRIANPNTSELTDLTEKALENFECVIVFDIYFHQLNYLKHIPQEKLVLFLWEPPSVKPENYDAKNHEIFSKVFTWNDELVDGKKYFKLYWPVLQQQISDFKDFKSKKFAALIATNRASEHPDELYSKRNLLAEFYENNYPDDLDLFGRGWPGSYKIYKGTLEDKRELLKSYKFNFAYENVKNTPGYVTEKIFDAFSSGCVPVYWGASNIFDYIPKNCFIARCDFESDSSLHEFLKNISEEQYLIYIKNIQNFLKGESASDFSFDHFVNMMMNLLKSRNMLTSTS